MVMSRNDELEGCIFDILGIFEGVGTRLSVNFDICLTLSVKITYPSETSLVKCLCMKVVSWVQNDSLQKNTPTG